MKIAGIQIESSDDLQQNVDKCLKLIDLSVEQGANIVIFPELVLTSWFPESIDEKNFSLALTMGAEEISVFKKVAKHKNIAIVLPFFEKDSEIDMLFYNSVIFIDKDGKIKGHYRKIHLPLIPNWEEKYYFRPGDLGFPVFETSFGEVGFQLGWDVFFPEVSRILTLKGAKLIISPTASAFSSQPRWVKVMSSNALINTVFICRVNRVGKQGDLDFYGGSFCALPDGGLVTEPAGTKEGIVLWEINFNDLYEVRRLFPFLKDRIDKEYLEIVGKSFKEILRD
jgi:N-carbamoylputrescine amidase